MLALGSVACNRPLVITAPFGVVAVSIPPSSSFIVYNKAKTLLNSRVFAKLVETIRLANQRA